MRSELIAVLDALDGGKELSGAQIGVAANLSSGSLYPALFKLEAEKRIESRWEWPVPLPDNPRRRLYRIARLNLVARHSA